MAKGATVLLVARFVSAASTLAVLAVIARRFDAQSVGAAAIGLTLGSLGVALIELGSGSLLVKEAAANRGALPQLLGAVIGLRALTSVAAVAILIPVSLAIYANQAPIVMVVALSLMAQQFAEITRAAFISMKRYAVAAGHTTLENVLWFLAIAVSVAAGAPLAAAMLVGLGCLVASAVAGMLMLRIARVSPRAPARSDVRAMTIRLRPFAAFGVLSTAAARIDVVIISIVAPAGLASVGAYFAASRLVAAAEYLPEAVGRVLLPEIVTSAHDRVARVGLAIAALMSLALPLPILAAIGGDHMMPLLMGPGYEGTGWLLALLCAALPFRFLSYALGVTLTGLGAQGRRAIAVGLSLAATAALDVVLVPRLGVAAAAAVSVIAAGIMTVAYAGAGRAIMPSLSVVRGSVRPVLATAGAIAVTVLPPFVTTGHVSLMDGAAFAIVYGLVLAIWYRRWPDRVLHAGKAG